MEVNRDNQNINVTVNEIFGTGVKSFTQTKLSEESHGENEVSVVLTNGATFTFKFYNGEKGEQGERGYGISNVQLNDDYTLTVTLENGMHFNTPSIRGEKGERGTGIRSVELRDDYSLLFTLENGKTLETTTILGKEFENIRKLEASATSASASASASAQSASNASISASESATNASESASASAQSATNASQSATNAQESASSASTSADTATSKATEASTSATKAKESEANAKLSETNASNSAKEAKASADSIANVTSDVDKLKEDLENKADYRVYTYGKTQSISLLDTNNENKINIFSQDVFQFGKNMITIPDREPETIKGVTYYVKNNILHINGTCTGWTGNNIIATDIPFPEVLFGKSTTVSTKIVEGNIIESNGYPQWRAFGNFGSNFGVAYRQTKTLTSITNNSITFAMGSGSIFNDVQVKFYLGFDKDYTDDFIDGYKKAVIGEISAIDGYLCKIDGSNFDYAEQVSEKTVAYLKDGEELHNANILYGKKWVACGDSFTEGDFSTYVDINGNTGVNSDAYDKDWSMYKTYPYWIAKRNGMKLINEAKCGSTMYRSNKDSDFSYQRYLNVPTDADYITLQFGLNEDWNDEILGKISDTDNTTVMGAWNVVMEYFLTNIPYAKIGIIISDAWTSIKMRNALIEVARYWGVPYLDMCGDDKVPLGTGGRRETAGKLSEKAKELRDNAYTVSATNSHPNVKAHQQRSTYIEQFLRSL